MNDDVKKLKEASLDFSLKVAIATTGLLFVCGIYFYFIRGLASIDLTLLPYMAIFTALTFFTFMAFKDESFNKGVLFTLLAFVVLALSAVKISWQNKQFSMKEPFIFYAHVEEFPSWEAYLLNPFTKQPNWLLFAKECGYPVLRGETFDAACTSLNSIENRYHFDAFQIVKDYHSLMQRTAALIEKRGTMNGEAYRTCVLKKECAQIPLLPTDVNPDEIAAGDDTYNHISRPYWDLVENKPLTPELCDFFPLCRVLRKTGAMKFEQAQ